MNTKTKEEVFTKYPLFGKVNIKKWDFLGDWVWVEGNCSSSPVIRGGKFNVEAMVYGNVPVHIFSNGSEAEGWLCGNCYECSKRNDSSTNPDDIRKNGGCALELRLALAYIDDGTIPIKTAKRIGYESISIQKNGIFVHLSECKEKQTI